MSPNTTKPIARESKNESTEEIGSDAEIEVRYIDRDLKEAEIGLGEALWPSFCYERGFGGVLWVYHR